MQRRRIPTLITSKELCEELRISYSTLARIVERGELDCLRIGGSMRFRREDVDLYLDRARFRTPPPRARQKTKPPSAPRRRERTGEIFDLEAYKKAGVYIPGRPYFKGMKVTIPSPETLTGGGEGK